MNDPAPTSDAHLRELVERAKAGDSHALEELFRLHLPGLTGFVRLRAATIVRARESCSDLTQTVFRETLQSLDEFEYRGPESFRKWMYTLAANKLSKRLRFYTAEKRSPKQEASLDETPEEVAAALGVYSRIHSPIEGASGSETMERMEEAFATLPEEHKEIILLAKVSELPHAEIAKVMDRSEDATRQLLTRALVRLSTALGNPR